MVTDVLEQLAASILTRKNEFSASMKTDMSVTTVRRCIVFRKTWNHQQRCENHKSRRT